MTRLLLTVLAFSITATAHAGNCYQQAVKAYAAPYYVQKAQVYYYVGANIRTAAILEAEKAADPEWRQFQEFKRFREEWEAFKQQQSQQPPPGAQAQQAPQTQIQASCVRCHSGAEPKGGRDFSGLLSADDLKAIKEILPSGKMPPPSAPEAKGFSNNLAGQVILDAIDQLTAGEVVDGPPPLPPPQEDAPLPPPTEQ